MIPPTPSVRAIVARHAEATADNRVFFHPDIPEHRLAEALTAYPGIAPEDVLVLFDNTESGSATEGLLLTEDAVHVCNGSASVQRLAFRDLHSAEFLHESPGVLRLNGLPALTNVLVRPETMDRVAAMVSEIASESLR